jgi:hypothetical protein
VAGNRVPLLEWIDRESQPGDRDPPPPPRRSSKRIAYSPDSGFYGVNPYDLPSAAEFRRHGLPRSARPLRMPTAAEQRIAARVQVFRGEAGSCSLIVRGSRNSKTARVVRISASADAWQQAHVDTQKNEVWFHCTLPDGKPGWERWYNVTVEDAETTKLKRQQISVQPEKILAKLRQRQSQPDGPLPKLGVCKEVAEALHTSERAVLTVYPKLPPGLRNPPHRPRRK